MSASSFVTAGFPGPAPLGPPPPPKGLSSGCIVALVVAGVLFLLPILASAVLIALKMTR